MKIAVTGHRPNKLGNDYTYTSPLSLRVMAEMKNIILTLKSPVYPTPKPITLISGMALGVDTMWALVARELGIPLIAAIPCLFQDAKWTKASQDLYHNILQTPINGKYPEIVWVTKEKYTPSCMQLRNKWMVDNCDLLVAVYNGDKSGGTYNCIEYALSVGKQIIYINV